jgi:hypothetical protein
MMAGEERLQLDRRKLPFTFYDATNVGVYYLSGGLSSFFVTVKISSNDEHGVPSSTPTSLDLRL